MKILYCFILKKNDGGTVHAKEFINAFRQNGNQLEVVSQEAISLEKANRSLSLIDKILAKIIWLSTNIIFLVRVFFAYIRYKPQAITFRYTPNHTALLAELLMQQVVPTVLEVNAINELENQSSLRIKLDRFLIKRTRNIFVVSNQIKDYLVLKNYCNEKNITVIENGVDTIFFNPNISSKKIRSKYALNNEVVIGFIGTFKAWHGVYKLLELAELMADYPCKFFLVGDGECKSDCENLTKSKRLTDKIIFAGFVPHTSIPEYIAAMDIVMAPYPQTNYQDRKEFFFSALKIFEYMAMAKAIIVPPMGQLKEVIVDNESGQLLYSEDTEALKNELLKLIADFEYRKKLGDNARNRVESMYTWRINAQKVHNLCLKAIETFPH